MDTLAALLPFPSILDTVLTPASLGPVLCSARIPEWLEWVLCTVQSSWGHVALAGAGVALHMVPALSRLHYMWHLLWEPFCIWSLPVDSMLDAVLGEAMCNMEPGLAGDGGILPTWLVWCMPCIVCLLRTRDITRSQMVGLSRGLTPLD